MSTALAANKDSLGPAEPRQWRCRVAAAFSRAAGQYTRLARAQQLMGNALWPLLPEQAGRVLDLGCGPGHWSRRLSVRYGPDCRVLGLDLAPGMLQVARHRAPTGLDWLCGDAAQLPLAASQFDLVFSNLAIQWCPDLDAVMAELHRVLRPGGRAVINSLGPGTLGEVGQAWSSPATLLAFRTRESHLASAHLAGFIRVECCESRERFHYPDLTAVMASIKGVGAQTTHAVHRLTRRDMERAACRYESLREAAGLPVSYQRLTLVLDKEPQA
ncbi:methyltransferase domain-containing protein [Billgrantia kenyensis]|uniref:Methyltransferase domain-containing protein n=1 Tax=Billgrantia kenyensis TaxID=321266 RepID=A0A7V9W0G1_9GAMM|nr:methyltransferase domain-containing protein [Halomonas kenyensis]MBA2778753.1 methyltransferase domain-containing protein [Halomonas kenyensis]MCG6661815.1 methyltransferase domain-containing protein [Halomonas kenyensis]